MIGPTSENGTAIVHINRYRKIKMSISGPHFKNGIFGGNHLEKCAEFNFLAFFLYEVPLNSIESIHIYGSLVVALIGSVSVNF